MIIEYIYKFFGLKSTTYFCTNYHVDFPLNQQTQKTKGCVYITAPKHVCDELVKLNGVEFKGKFLFIEIAKVKPKVTNSNKIDFTSSNRFEPLGFASNIADLGNDIEHIEEISLRVDFKRTVRDSQKNSKHISKWRPPFVINSHPENQMAFSEVPIIPVGISYNDAITKKTAAKYIDFYRQHTKYN